MARLTWQTAPCSSAGLLLLLLCLSGLESYFLHRSISFPNTPRRHGSFLPCSMALSQLFVVTLMKRSTVPVLSGLVRLSMSPAPLLGAGLPTALRTGPPCRPCAWWHIRGLFPASPQKSSMLLVWALCPHRGDTPCSREKDGSRNLGLEIVNPLPKKFGFRLVLVELHGRGFAFPHSLKIPLAPCPHWGGLGQDSFCVRRLLFSFVVRDLALPDLTAFRGCHEALFFALLFEESRRFLLNLVALYLFCLCSARCSQRGHTRQLGATQRWGDNHSLHCLRSLRLGRS